MKASGSTAVESGVTLAEVAASDAVFTVSSHKTPRHAQSLRGFHLPRAVVEAETAGVDGD
jgi:hypothetical protein